MRNADQCTCQDEIGCNARPPRNREAEKRNFDSRKKNFFQNFLNRNSKSNVEASRQLCSSPIIVGRIGHQQLGGGNPFLLHFIA